MKLDRGVSSRVSSIILLSSIGHTLTLQVARENEGVETPKLGGVTRWCQEKPIFRISSDEWEKYLACLDFSWDPSKFSNKCGPACEMFAAIYEAVVHYIWPLPLVNRCDSWLYVLAYVCIAHARPPLLPMLGSYGWLVNQSESGYRHPPPHISSQKW